MTRKSNKGVSIVEILIALAVFIILLIPIVSSVITGMKTTTSAKELQYRNEYARNLMENVKEVPLSVLDTANSADPAVGPAVDYFKNMGARDVKVKKTGKGYEVTGKTNIGTENTEYAFQIEVDGSSYDTINKLKNGVVEDLDQTKVALISAPLSNYDYSAYDTLLTKKMAQLQSSTSTPYDASNDITKFNGDTCARTINITVKESGTRYKVECILEYRDRSHCAGVNEVSETYVPYCQEFDKVPNIYLMYNACVYNNRYAKDVTIGGALYPAECIKLNVQDGIGPVNVFVIATSSVDDNKNYRAIAGATRPNVSFVKDNDDVNVCVYHNFATLDDPSDSNDDNDAIQAEYTHFKSEQYGDLNDAWDGRSMFDVRIRMQKGSSIDMSIDPILQGTRGGDGIE